MFLSMNDYLRMSIFIYMILKKRNNLMGIGTTGQWIWVPSRLSHTKAKCSPATRTCAHKQMIYWHVNNCCIIDVIQNYQYQIIYIAIYNDFVVWKLFQSIHHFVYDFIYFFNNPLPNYPLPIKISPSKKVSLN